MASKLKTFASGALGEKRSGNTVYTLYTVPSGKAIIIHTMSFVNIHTDDVPFTVWLFVSPTVRYAVLRQDHPLPAGQRLLEEGELTLGPKGSILAKIGKDSDPNNSLYPGKIHFIIGGMEREVGD